MCRGPRPSPRPRQQWHRAGSPGVAQNLHRSAPLGQHDGVLSWSGQEPFELRDGESGLAQDRRERAPLDSGVLRDHDNSTFGVSVDRVAALGPGMDESGLAECLNDLTKRQVSQGWAHAAVAIWNEVTSGVDSMTGCVTSSR
jgi:hypothetical protein